MSDEPDIVETSEDAFGARPARSRFRRPNGEVLRPFGRNALTISEAIAVPVTDEDRDLAASLDAIRPKPIREFDQIPMLAVDLIRQAKLILPFLAGRDVVFVGDFDCASLLIALLGIREKRLPSRILILDFDARVLRAAEDTARYYGFHHILDTRLYNVFDRLPTDLVGQFDWFYTNPPYGASNSGESARLFVARGIEACSERDSHGCIILPYGKDRPWTQDSLIATQTFIISNGWIIQEQVTGMHHYHLHDDKDLTSALIVTQHIQSSLLGTTQYSGRRVTFEEIPAFYGKSVKPPYPHYVTSAGALIWDWDTPLEDTL